MNEADFPSIDLNELRLVPDWLREGTPPASKQYAGHVGPSDRELRPMSRGPQGGGGQGNFGRDRRDARPGGDRQRDARGPGSGGGQRRDDRRDNRAPDRRPPREDAGPARPAQPAPVQVVFLPDDLCLASIIKQIRSTHMAYPLFSLARMFLQEPARHWVQFTVEPAAAQTGTKLYQLGEEGPITLDRAVLERIAFDSAREQYYSEQTEQKEPLKGNFANVARERQSGTLLGPTNHHGYQPALRALYEARFSRRMSFEDYRRNIEVVSDPALVERWKEEARTVKTIVTKEGEPPTVLQSMADARAHFKQHYFDGLVQSGNVRRVHGSVARGLPDASMMQAIRQAHERELRYPAQFVQSLREGLQNAGLHIFKHRKRIVYVSISRPTPFIPGNGAVSASVAAILDFIGKSPLCTRKNIAEHLLAKGTTTAAPAAEPVANETVTETPAIDIQPAPVAETDAAKAKAALAADLRFLVQAGHIIEFHNGTFDLPLSPKAKEEPAAGSALSSSKKPAMAESSDDVGADPATVAAPVPSDSSEPESQTKEGVVEAVAAEPAEPEVPTESSAEASPASESDHPTEAGSTPEPKRDEDPASDQPSPATASVT